MSHYRDTYLLLLSLNYLPCIIIITERLYHKGSRKLRNLDMSCQFDTIIDSIVSSNREFPANT